MEDSLNRDLGPQPLDEILSAIGIGNHALVDLSTEQLTHKQVQKARKGRRVSVNIQRKILKAINARAVVPGAAEPKRIYELGDLFNYRG